MHGNVGHQLVFYISQQNLSVLIVKRSGLTACFVLVLERNREFLAARVNM